MKQGQSVYENSPEEVRKTGTLSSAEYHPLAYKRARAHEWVILEPTIQS